MAENSKYSKMSKEQVFSTLRREILAAQLKVELDKQLERETSPTVQRLAKMKLPALPRFEPTPTVVIPSEALEKSGFRVVRTPSSTLERRVTKGGFLKRAKTHRSVAWSVPKVEKTVATDSTAATQK